MTIVERQKVRAAVHRAIALDPHQDLDAAVAGVAQALCLPPETVSGTLDEAPEMRDAVRLTNGKTVDLGARWNLPT
jgi:hypothetical protein